ncbi:hypothetical protein C8R46DRAFT_185800 [Mycena filopes]|nr:hypothetical protein C8R46DRAFT_185800 [Mycena filopes]
MRFITISVLSTTSTFFLAHAAPVGEHYSAVPPVPRTTEDVFEEIHLPPRQAENIKVCARAGLTEAPCQRSSATSGCVVA